jgi:ribosomal protein S18 acetylase RimI-like enzyme
VTSETRRLLEVDRIWSAYALADLEPEEQANSLWLTGERATVLLYHGLEPPVLFAQGDPHESARLASGIAPRRVVYTLLPETLEAIGKDLEIEHQAFMWRMRLEKDRFPAGGDETATLLGEGDHEAIRALFDDHADRPDAFHPRQLERGVFFGVRESGRLLGIAGTHILARGAGIAAVGNVFTHPAWRGRGIARRATAAVVSELLRRGYSTVVLNVAQSNEPAIRCYRRLGFIEHCAYHEGLGRLQIHPSDKGEPHG